MGRILYKKGHLKNQRGLFVYWLLTSLASTIIQIYYTYELLYKYFYQSTNDPEAFWADEHEGENPQELMEDFICNGHNAKVVIANGIVCVILSKSIYEKVIIICENGKECNFVSMITSLIMYI